MHTKHPITVHYGWLRKPLVLPIGTRLYPAKNIPDPGCYWVRSIPRSVTDRMPVRERIQARDWCSVYGFLIRPDQLTHSQSAATL
jgi:hypothetical protein